MSLTAEQKIRETITGSPVVEPIFQHEGEEIVRWLTGGTLPDAWVIFHPDGEQIIIKCATCQNILGSFPANYDPERTVRALTQARLVGHEGHMPAGWPSVSNITGA